MLPMAAVPRFAIALLTLAVSGVACSGGGGTSTTSVVATSTGETTPTTSTATPTSTDAEPTAASGATRRVPDDFPTIQAAVDAADPGDLILIAPGVYREAVTVPVDKERLVIRGLDRNEVVLDGRTVDRSNGFWVFAAGVAIENLTVRYFESNGILFNPDPVAVGDDGYLEGWRASYVTAYGNGLYGVYAIQARHGQFDHVYASGSPDSGIYVGQCTDCAALVVDSIAEYNQAGYEGTNAGGVTVARNVFRRNRVGIIVNSLDKEKFAPSDGGEIIGNVVVANAERKAAAGTEGFAIGIAAAGAQRVRIERNLVRRNESLGIVVAPSPDGYEPLGVEVRGNAVADHRFDLAYFGQAGAGAWGSCFEDNVFKTSAPDDIETSAACGAGTDQPTSGNAEPEGAPGRKARQATRPPDQEQMPDAATAPARPAVGLPEPFDTGALAVPEAAP